MKFLSGGDDSTNGSHFYTTNVGSSFALVHRDGKSSKKMYSTSERTSACKVEFIQIYT